MMTMSPRLAARVPVCRWQAWSSEKGQAGRAERAEKGEGKIEETGTLSGRFPKLLLSAHWLGEPARHSVFGRLVPRFVGNPAFTGFLTALWPVSPCFGLFPWDERHEC